MEEEKEIKIWKLVAEGRVEVQRQFESKKYKHQLEDAKIRDIASNFGQLCYLNPTTWLCDSAQQKDAKNESRVYKVTTSSPPEVLVKGYQKAIRRLVTKAR